MGGAGGGAGDRAEIWIPAAGPLVTADGADAGRSGARSTETGGKGFGGVGVATGPTATGGGITGLGGGGPTTARRAVALISAIERVN